MPREVQYSCPDPTGKCEYTNEDSDSVAAHITGSEEGWHEGRNGFIMFDRIEETADWGNEADEEGSSEESHRADGSNGGDEDSDEDGGLHEAVSLEAEHGVFCEDDLEEVKSRGNEEQDEGVDFSDVTVDGDGGTDDSDEGGSGNGVVSFARRVFSALGF